MQGPSMRDIRSPEKSRDSRRAISGVARGNLQSFWILPLVVMPVMMSKYMHQWTREEENKRQRVDEVPCVIRKQIDAESCERERDDQTQLGAEKSTAMRHEHDR